MTEAERKEVRTETIQEVSDFLKLAEAMDGSDGRWSRYVLLLLKADKIVEGK